ncbi:MAG TPA: UDP-N-acetylmuramate:L-alanyl-gamma-D-glutamyl-meso-diaminopimelate ligase, partial [Burkholderiaceae bacterium]|nr:UDP-N-acetylmuramate:L-alanyl-gamma-D-glutamyl-meso-diaminopimelate ligase [Burkholderiaceae bacterium]
RLNPDLFIVGNVVSRGNPLMEAILDQGLAYASGPQWLGEQILRKQHVLAVAGTHGKTTTSAMLAWILEQTGHRPNFLVGGLAPGLEVSARYDPGQPWFVIEADEYDTAFFDKRSKFVHYRPRTLVLNNLEFDHADIFPDLAAIETQFHHLVRTVPAAGQIIRLQPSDALDRVLARGAWTPTIGFGPQGQWQAGPPDADNAFDVLRNGALMGRLESTQAGEHNQQNALAAIAAANHVGVTPQAAIGALSVFEGVRRRLELRGVVQGIHVYDDFAHHPTAIALTLQAVRRQAASDQRLIAVLEPRSNTMKLGTMARRLPAALEPADQVYCYSVSDGKHALGWDAATALAPLGQRAHTFTDLQALITALADEARPNDQIVIMSNGSFGDIHNKLLATLRQRLEAHPS